MKRRLVKILNSCKRKFLNVCSYNILLSKLYFFCTSNYGREQQSLLKGIKHFSTLANNEKRSISLLRRNTHRLEKGLIMSPRKTVYAVDYIYQTVELFSESLGNPLVSDQERDWFFSVLKYYFEVVDIKHQQVRLSYDLFSSINYRPLSLERKPYSYKDKKLPIHESAFQCLAYKRASTRWFESGSAPSQEVVKKAVDISMQAPSACNRQSFEYRYITNKELLQKVLALPGGVTGFASNIPSLVVVIGDYSGYYLERDRHLIYIDSSLSSMLMLLAFEEHGFNTCVLNWPENDKKNKAINELLGLPEYKRVIMLIAVGRADLEGGVPFSQKKNHKSVLKIHD